MGKFSEANLFGMTIRESANDGSDFTNPDADYRRLFLGEDGLLHLKDSAGAVTDVGGAGGGPAGSLPVQVKSNAVSDGGASTLAVTMDSTPTNGNILIACISIIGTQNVSSIAGTNITWTQLAETTDATSPKVEIWKGVVAASAGTTQTITFSANVTDRSMVVSEWAGVAGTLDQSAARAVVATGSAGTGFQQTSGVILPTDPDALVIAMFGCTNGTTRYGTTGALVPFTPVRDNTGSLAGFQWSGYGFPGTVPIAANVSGHTTGNYSALIISVT